MSRRMRCACWARWTLTARRADEPEENYNLLDEQEDVPDANDTAREELKQRYHSPHLVRYFPEDRDPRLDWMNDGVRLHPCS